MQCTRCKAGNLQASFIEQQFRAHTCDHCGGNWILVEDYMTWKERNPQYSFAKVVITDDDVADSQRALLCPVTGKIMRKLKITKDSSHRIDYSMPVGGVWLDKGEWELLKSAGLAGSLNAILTEQWQTKIREQKAEETFTQLYLNKFGEDDYQKIKALREWLNNHPRKADLQSYLLADDPYSAKK
jgi:Zn-finger nucleic acid-binding protein